MQNSTPSAAALAIAAILGSVGLLAFLTAWRRSGHTLAQFCLYIVNDCFTRVLWRTEISGPLPVRDNQGALIVCNHISGIDPLLIQLCTHRVVHWMVAREYIEMAGIRYVFRALRSIAVNRKGVDTAATKTAIRLAREGGLVGLFPEGRVNMTSEFLLPGRNGAALIALKAKVPVIPCYVSGSPYDGTALGCFFISARAKVVVGAPMDLSAYYDRANDKGVQDELTLRFLCEITKLAGHPEFQPKLVRREARQSLENGSATLADEPEPVAPATNGRPS